MKRRALLAAMCAASALVFPRSSASGTPVILRPAIRIPTQCDATPVYGDYLPGSSPFIVAQPRFAGITMRLSQGVPKNLTYEPIRSGGADVLLEARSSSVTITVVYYAPIYLPVITHPPTAIRTPSPVLLRTGYYQRLYLPHWGCWQLRLQAGTDTGYITLWAR